MLNKRMRSSLRKLLENKVHAVSLMTRHAIELDNMSDAISLANVLSYRISKGLPVDGSDIKWVERQVLAGTWRQC